MAFGHSCHGFWLLLPHWVLVWIVCACVYVEGEVCMWVCVCYSEELDCNEDKVLLLSASSSERPLPSNYMNCIWKTGSGQGGGWGGQSDHRQKAGGAAVASMQHFAPAAEKRSTNSLWGTCQEQRSERRLWICLHVRGISSHVQLHYWCEGGHKTWGISGSKAVLKPNQNTTLLKTF